MDVMEKVFQCGIVPVIKLDDAKNAVPLCSALADGGVSVAEITFRTDAAEESIHHVAQHLPEVLVGAGTVLTVAMAEKALKAGAKFVVTPGINRPVLEFCLERNIPIFPGCSSPSDLETALSYGLKIVKFFPAEAVGGLKALKAMSAPYSMLRFMPTGGIDGSNLGEYMRFPKILACGGSWMVGDNLIKTGRFEEITEITRDAVMKMHGFTFHHMGINPEGSSAENIAGLFTEAFGFDQIPGNTSIFAGGKTLEIMREKGPGDCGHIAIRTNNVRRAMAFLEKKGYAMNMDSLKGPADAPLAVYLKDSFGPFAVHLLQA